MQEPSPSPTPTTLHRVGHFRTREESTLLEYLIRSVGLNGTDARRLISFGAVYEESRRASTDRSLAAGRYIRVHFAPKRYPVAHVDWKASIVHCDDACVVVNKPAGVPVHSTLDNLSENVAHQIGTVLGTPVFVTQRLDIDVSGLMVLARTRQFQREFNRMLKERRVHKRYRALVTSALEIGRQEHYMEPTLHSPKNVVAEPREAWLFCALNIVSVEPYASRVGGPQAYSVEIDLETGRTHQIRAQLAALGCPIIGDSLYGSAARYEIDGTLFPGIALASISVSWPGMPQFAHTAALG